MEEITFPGIKEIFPVIYGDLSLYVPPLVT